MSRNLIIRTIVAVIFGPLIILISYLGGNWLAGMILLLAALGIIEFMLDIKISAGSPSFWVTLLFTLGIIVAGIYLEPEWSLRLFVGYFLCIGVITAARGAEPTELYKQNSALVWGVTYLALLYPFLYYIRELVPGHGGDWLLFLWGTLWLSDTLAMAVGKGIGRKKLVPKISPNKTVAGFFGGLFGGLVIALILGYWLLSDVMLILLLGAGLAVSLVGQMGDLVESVWKRALGIKDSSAIIPGHGGILDRFDSLLFAAPVLFWYLKYIVYV
ncbi:MAG: phosphatidate cytidylyltransferase [candidate division Zixibacteria bacterium]|nr:phosphatidate cytidylyltransferase [candidate division Zixibacteria bacterium]